MTGADRAEEEPLRLATGHTSYGDRLLEVPALHRDGRTLSIAFTVTLIGKPHGRPDAIVAVVRDDTQRWQERRALRQELAARVKPDRNEDSS